MVVDRRESGPRRSRASTVRWGAAFLLSFLLSACGGGEEHSAAEQAITLEVWLHAGSPAEQRTLQAQVADFNAHQYRIRVNAVILPEADYETRIQEAAEQGRLPDIVEVRSARVARYAWSGYIRPIDKLLTDETHRRLFPPVNDGNRFHGRIYAVAAHAEPVMLYARKDLLVRYGVEPPPDDRAWSLDAFETALGRMARAAGGRPVLEVDLGTGGRRSAETLLPAIESAGGGLIDLRDGPRVVGVFDSAGNAAVLARLRSWARRGWIVARHGRDGDRFQQGAVPLAWTWMRHAAAYRRRWGSDLVVTPPPDFGRGRRLYLASWGWAVTRDSPAPQAAMHFLEFMLEDPRISEIAEAGHTLPASRTALARRADEALDEARIVYTARAGEFVLLPRTPAYPLFERTLGKIVGEVFDGRDVTESLHDEAEALQRKIAGFQRP